MASIQKFLFDQSFDDGRRQQARAQEQEDAAPPPPPPPPEPTYTRAELQSEIASARKSGHEAGFAEGRVVGREEAETADQRAFTEALTAVDTHLQQLLQAEFAAREAREEGTVRIALSIVRKLVPAYVAAHGHAEVLATVTRFVADLVEEPKLILRLHEQWLERIKPRMEDIAARNGFAGSVTVLADPRLTPMEVRADWGDGGAERDPAALWAEIERIAGVSMAGIPGGPAVLKEVVDAAAH